jgi:hypothetical protein
LLSSYRLTVVFSLTQEGRWAFAAIGPHYRKPLNEYRPNQRYPDGELASPIGIRQAVTLQATA